MNSATMVVDDLVLRILRYETYDIAEIFLRADFIALMFPAISLHTNRIFMSLTTMHDGSKGYEEESFANSRWQI